MTMQTKLTARAIPLMLFFSLWSISVWAPAGSAIVARQAAPEDSATVNAGESVAGPQEGAFTTHVPGPTIALLETVR